MSKRGWESTSHSGAKGWGPQSWGEVIVPENVRTDSSAGQCLRFSHRHVGENTGMMGLRVFFPLLFGGAPQWLRAEGVAMLPQS